MQPINRSHREAVKQLLQPRPEDQVMSLQEVPGGHWTSCFSPVTAAVTQDAAIVTHAGRTAGLSCCASRWGYTACNDLVNYNPRALLWKSNLLSLWLYSLVGACDLSMPPPAPTLTPIGPATSNCSYLSRLVSSQALFSRIILSSIIVDHFGFNFPPPSLCLPPLASLSSPRPPLPGAPNDRSRAECWTLIFYRPTYFRPFAFRHIASEPWEFLQHPVFPDCAPVSCRPFVSLVYCP